MHTNRRKMLIATGTVIAAGLSGCSDADDRDNPDDEYDSDDNPDTEAASQAISEADLTRTDSATEIDFTVVFVNPLLAVDPTEHPLHEIAEDAIVFDVAMDTHSGDLTTKEWGSRATLTTDEEVRVEGLDWVWNRKSEHHPTGHYQAPTKLPTGVPVVEATTEELILEIRANDDATVQFTWNLETYDELAIPDSSAVPYH